MVTAGMSSLVAETPQQSIRRYGLNLGCVGNSPSLSSPCGVVLDKIPLVMQSQYHSSPTVYSSMQTKWQILRSATKNGNCST